MGGEELHAVADSGCLPVCVCSAFAAGLATALVCDCGAGSTSAVPVVDGFALSTKGWVGGWPADRTQLCATELDKL